MFRLSWLHQNFLVAEGPPKRRTWCGYHHPLWSLAFLPTLTPPSLPLRVRLTSPLHRSCSLQTHTNTTTTTIITNTHTLTPNSSSHHPGPFFLHRSSSFLRHSFHQSSSSYASSCSSSFGFKNLVTPHPSANTTRSVYRGKSRVSHVVGSSQLPEVNSDHINHSSSQNSPSTSSTPGIRINKCFKHTHSRRQADALVASGRVRINRTTVAHPGSRVVPGDLVTLDGKLIDWERLNVLEHPIDLTHKAKHNTDRSTTLTCGPGTSPSEADSSNPSSTWPLSNPDSPILGADKSRFVYIKFHKPVNVISTTDPQIKHNLIQAFQSYPHPHPPRDRVFPVGRLDRETSGLILLTSDGRLVKAALGKSSPHFATKEYIVQTHPRVSSHDLKQLREGVVIKTIAQYARGNRKGDKKFKPVIAPTLPCICERVNGARYLRQRDQRERRQQQRHSSKSSSESSSSSEGGVGRPEPEGEDRWIRFVLKEGRNRQIRRMLAEVGQGYSVLTLHRVRFLGIDMTGIQQPGSWAYLNDAELQQVDECIRYHHEKTALNHTHTQHMLSTTDSEQEREIT